MASAKNAGGRERHDHERLGHRGLQRPPQEIRKASCGREPALGLRLPFYAAELRRPAKKGGPPCGFTAMTLESLSWPILKRSRKSIGPVAAELLRKAQS